MLVSRHTVRVIPIFTELPVHVLIDQRTVLSMTRLIWSLEKCTSVAKTCDADWQAKRGRHSYTVEGVWARSEDLLAKTEITSTHGHRRNTSCFKEATNRVIVWSTAVEKIRWSVVFSKDEMT